MVDPGGISVLHVDDEPGFADMAATHLERTDERLSIETATSASEGLELLDGDTFDCVVSDYDMPCQNGIEFLRAVRDRDQDLPFIQTGGEGGAPVGVRLNSGMMSANGVEPVPDSVRAGVHAESPPL